jgi:hypothetical protein
MMYPDRADAWIDEECPPDPFPLAQANLAAEANANCFSSAGGTGVVLRFGWFYGPGATHSEEFFALARRHIAWPVDQSSSCSCSLPLLLRALLVASCTLFEWEFSPRLEPCGTALPDPVLWLWPFLGIVQGFVQKWAISLQRNPTRSSCALLPLPPEPSLNQRTPGRSAVWDGVSDPCGRDRSGPDAAYQSRWFAVLSSSLHARSPALLG